MMKFKFFIIIPLLPFFVSCSNSSDEIPKTSFERAFPGQNVNLSEVLGNTFVLKNRTDTSLYRIFSYKDNNVITESPAGDTIFNGKVCRYRGYYYFNFQLDNNSFWYGAMKKKGNLLYGFTSLVDQIFLVEDLVQRGKFNKLIKYSRPEKGITRLWPDKNEVRRLFSIIVDSLPADTMVVRSAAENKEPLFETRQIEKEESEFIRSISPNPVKDYLTIDVFSKEKMQFELSNFAGKVFTRGKFTSSRMVIDLRHLSSGTYILKVFQGLDTSSEQVKITKNS